jgi:transcriptional regulator with XRE-family HTH domain
MNDKYQPDVVVEHNDITYLIETAKGSGRSYEAYARMAGISSAAMSKIRSGKYRPSPETLRKLSSDKANPQGGVTYEDFMKSLGYAGESESDTDQHSDTLSQYEKEITSQIYTALFEKEILSKKVNDDCDRRMYDLEIKLIDRPVESWFFSYLYFSPVRRSDPGMLYKELGRIMTTDFGGGKVTIVLNDPQVFEMFKTYERKLSFRGELSLLMYDMDLKMITGEYYLANAVEGDVSREIYLS